MIHMMVGTNIWFHPDAFPRRYGQQDSDVTPAWEEASGWNHMFVPTIIHPSVKPVTPVDDDFQDTEEYVEESLSLDVYKRQG